MGLFGNRTQQEIEEIEELLLLVLRDLSQLKPKPPRPRMVLISNFNNTKSIIMSLSIASNQKAAIIIGLVDATTLAPITATSTGETNSIDNTAVATVDASNNVVGVAAGSANLTSTATWTYTDSNTQLPVTVTLTIVTPITVTAVVTAESVQMVVTFGTPVAQ